MKRIDLTGKDFGRMTVIRSLDMRNNRLFWECRCACGAISEVDGANLRSGHTTSCGCYKLERISQAQFKHGHGHGSPIWHSYYHALRRCNNPKDPRYPRYGGRGIKMLYASFEEFLKDMGPTWEQGLTLERKNNDGNYEPGNCKWATRIEQANNRSTNRKFEYNGTTKTVAEWARQFKIVPHVLYAHLNAGNPFEALL
jgi:hypothetical protein